MLWVVRVVVVVLGELRTGGLAIGETNGPYSLRELTTLRGVPVGPTYTSPPAPELLLSTQTSPRASTAMFCGLMKKVPTLS